jgi:hypothetical protein
MKRQSIIAHRLKNIAIMFLLMACVFLLYNYGHQATKSGQIEHQVNVQAHNAMVTHEVAAKLSDTVKRILELKFLHDTTSLPADTAAMVKRELALTVKYETILKVVRDSVISSATELNSIREEKRSLVADVKKLVEAKKNVTFKGVAKIRNIDSANADIVVFPFKKQARATFFSPQKNYLRVFNKYPGGTINSQPFYDYEQTNDEINMLLFQARTAYNFSAKQPSFGPGIEMKVNRLSVNAALLFNSNADTLRNRQTPVRNLFNRATFSIGGRWDIYRIRFK